MHSLAPIAGITSRLRVDLDAEAAVVEAGERLPELRPAAVRRVVVVPGSATASCIASTMCG